MDFFSRGHARKIFLAKVTVATPSHTLQTATNAQPITACLSKFKF